MVVWQQLVLVGLLLAWCPVNEGIRYLGPFGFENEKTELMLEINSFLDVLVTIDANYPLSVTKHYLTLALQALGPGNPGYLPREKHRIELTKVLKRVKELTKGANKELIKRALEESLTFLKKELERRTEEEIELDQQLIMSFWGLLVVVFVIYAGLEYLTRDLPTEIREEEEAMKLQTEKRNSLREASEKRKKVLIEKRMRLVEKNKEKMKMRNDKVRTEEIEAERRREEDQERKRYEQENTRKMQDLERARKIREERLLREEEEREEKEKRKIRTQRREAAEKYRNRLREDNKKNLQG